MHEDLIVSADRLEEIAVKSILDMMMDFAATFAPPLIFCFMIGVVIYWAMHPQVFCK
jgi:hypothetical protein